MLAPLLTLIGCIIALVHRLAGAITVLAGGSLSALAFLIDERGITENAVPYLPNVTAPVLGVGVGLLFLSWWRVSTGTSTSPDTAIERHARKSSARSSW